MNIIVPELGQFAVISRQVRERVGDARLIPRGCQPEIALGKYRWELKKK